MTPYSTVLSMAATAFQKASEAMLHAEHAGIQATGDDIRFAGYARDYAKHATRLAADVAASVHLYTLAKTMDESDKHWERLKRDTEELLWNYERAIQQAQRVTAPHL